MAGFNPGAFIATAARLRVDVSRIGEPAAAAEIVLRRCSQGARSWTPKSPFPSHAGARSSPVIVGPTRVDLASWVSNEAMHCSPRCRSSGSTRRVHQPRSPTSHRATSRPATRRHHDRADHLRPATIAPPRADRAGTAHSPLPRHGHRPSNSDVPVSAVHDRLLPTGLANLSAPTPTRLRAASTTYRAAIIDLAQRTGLAA